MDVGVFFPMEPAGRAPGDDYRSTLELIRDCESLGYNSVWIASRHLSSMYASVPSPIVLLAAAAAITERLVLGTSIISLPLQDALQVAEDFAVLDAISKGRGRLGVGSGDDPPAFEAMGVAFDERQGVLSDKLREVIRLLEGGPVGASGLRIHPAVEGPLNKVALGAQSARGAAWAGSLGIGLLQGRSEPKAKDPTVSQARAAEAYREVHPQGRVTTARNVWIGSVADERFSQALRRYDSYLRSRGRDPLPNDPVAAAQKMNVLFGRTAQDVAEQAVAMVGPIKPDELLVTVDPGGLDDPSRKERLVELASALGLGAS
ncbi:MAG: LLM class flavin-dependent oxidoreductase [Actinomycetota bacterium]